MPALSRLRSPTLLVLALSLAACQSAPTGYLRDNPEAMARMAEQPSKPDDQATYLALISKMQEQGAWFASLAHIDAFQQKFGNSPELRLLQARALHLTGQTEAAEPLYKGLLNGPQAAAAWHGLGLIAASRERQDSAEQGLLRAVQLDPLNPAYLGDLGFAYLRSGQLDEARAPLAKAAELTPGDPKAIANLALWTMLRGDTGRADAMMLSAELPAATRDGVYRLAIELRARWPVPSASGTAPPAAATGSRSPNHNTAAPAANSQPPRSMLQRFTEFPSSPTSKVAQ